jgi:hypothetical protein
MTACRRECQQVGQFVKLEHVITDFATAVQRAPLGTLTCGKLLMGHCNTIMRVFFA